MTNEIHHPHRRWERRADASPKLKGTIPCMEMLAKTCWFVSSVRDTDETDRIYAVTKFERLSRRPVVGP